MSLAGNPNGVGWILPLICSIARLPKEKFMLKLYARPGAGSAAVEAILAECGVAFEIIDVLRGPDGFVPQSYRQINPRAEVPTLVLPDNSIMTESAAMMIYLADLHPAAGLALPFRAAGALFTLMLYSPRSLHGGFDVYPARHSWTAHAGHQAKAIGYGGL
jgi:glutathione S-transferase